MVRKEAWEGLRDSVDLLEDVVEAVPKTSASPLLAVFARMQRAIEHGRDNAGETYATVRLLCEDISPELDRELLDLLEAGAFRQETDLLRELRTAIDHACASSSSRKCVTSSMPCSRGWRWAAKSLPRPSKLPTTLRLDEIPRVSRRLRDQLDAWQRERGKTHDVSPEMAASAQRLTDAFVRAEAHAAHLRAELLALAGRAQEDASGMDFRLLFDAERKLFRIGYNATADQVDTHHYDLLASEARLASYLAIVDHAVPESHWYALGRPMTQVAGGPLLLSWGGTMFEYLMPELLMRSREGTLLARTSEHVVDAQIAYAKTEHEPWGVSESAYARLDADQTYQYRAFGVPLLGLKRGLDEDHVVAPYASILAVGIRPRAVVENLAALEKMGMLGTYGMFEALDLTPERAVDAAPQGQRAFAVVRSYMAHHQGMLLVALGNFLNDRTMVDRFHADPRVETGEVLLNEHAPARHAAGVARRRRRRHGRADTLEAPLPPTRPGPWSPVGQRHAAGVRP